LINGINSSLDNDTGVYTMDLSTNWMGNADDWVIATAPKESSEYVYTVLSNELNSWQIKTGRGLEDAGSRDESILSASGAFDTSYQYTLDQWQLSGTLRTFGILNLNLSVDVLTNLGENIYIEIYDGASLVALEYLGSQGQSFNLGNFGVSDDKEYTFTIKGTPLNKGIGRISVVFSTGSVISTVKDDILFLEAIADLV
jgi:hypothetical protein